MITTGGNSSVNYQIGIDSAGIISDTFNYFDGYQIPTQICMSDFDQDGYNEIVVGQHGWGAVTLYQDSANYKYKQTIFKSVYGTFNTTSMDVGDVNNDGLPDIVIGDQQDSFKVHYNTSKIIKPILKNPTFTFYDCPAMKLDTVTNISFITKYALSSLSGCNVNTANSYKVVNKYTRLSGVGDSLYYTSYCKKDVVYLRRNFAVNVVKPISSDTLFDKIISKSISFPQGNYTIGGASTLCANRPIDLFLEHPSQFNYNSIWYLDKDSIMSNQLHFDNLSAGTYTYPFKVYFKDNEVYCAMHDTILINVHIPPANISIIGKDTICAGEKNVLYKILSKDNSVFNWTIGGFNNQVVNNENSVRVNINDNPNISVFTEGLPLYVQEKAQNGCTGSIATKVIQVLKINDCLFVPNVFTPNHDGMNDVFDVKQINRYPENKLKIYDRWGGLVYSVSNYTGDWDANLVADGLYYYSFEINNAQTFKGWLQIVR